MRSAVPATAAWAGRGLSRRFRGCQTAARQEYRKRGLLDDAIGLRPVGGRGGAAGIDHRGAIVGAEANEKRREIRVRREENELLVAGRVAERVDGVEGHVNGSGAAVAAGARRAVDDLEAARNEGGAIGAEGGRIGIAAADENAAAAVLRKRRRYQPAGFDRGNPGSRPLGQAPGRLASQVPQAPVKAVEVDEERTLDGVSHSPSGHWYARL